MTTRVGSLGQGQLLLDQLLQQQNSLAVVQQQLSTGHKADDLKGIARDASSLLSTKTLVSRAQQFIENNKQLGLKLSSYDSALQGVSSVAQDLRDSVLQAINLNSGTGLIEKVKNILGETLDQLNKQVNGEYIFGGTRTDQPPVTVTTAAGLIALPEPPTAAFANNQLKPQVKIDDNITVVYGQLADAVGAPLMHAIQRILQFDAGTVPSGATGPAGTFGSTLTAAQRDYLLGEVTNLNTVSQDLNEVTAQNGVHQAELTKVQDRKNTEVNVLNGFISDIQDVDTAGAITKLNQDQLALQASYSVLSQLNKLSLLNFL